MKRSIKDKSVLQLIVHSYYEDGTIGIHLCIELGSGSEIIKNYLPVIGIEESDKTDIKNLVKPTKTEGDYICTRDQLNKIIDKIPIYLKD